MVCCLEDPMVSFLLIMLQSVLKSSFGADDRDYSPASSLEAGCVQRRFCVVDVEGLAKQILLFGYSSDDGVFDAVPSDVVGVQLSQPVTTCVHVGCTMGSLHPLVHSTS